MNGHAERRGPAPDVDEGDARHLIALLRRELRPTPGRPGDCLRIVGVVLALVAIAETQRRQDRRDRLATRYEQNNIAREGNFGDAKLPSSPGGASGPRSRPPGGVPGARR